MGETTISWTERTWNPVRGCSRISPGCQNCYAERMAARGLPGHRSPTTGHSFAIMQHSGPRWTGKVELIPHMLDVPLKRRKPTMYFVNSMSDLFHEGLPFDAIDRVFAAMALCPQHTFQVLTKRAKRMREYFDADPYGRITLQGSKMRGLCGTAIPLPNVWLGVSVEDQQRKDRIDELRETPAAVRFLSLEPLLEDLGTLGLRGINWVIVGGESGPGARACDIAWLRSIVAQCKAAGVACFVKQLGARPIYQRVDGSRELKQRDRKGGEMSEWPEDLRVREMPTTTEPR